MSSWSFRLLAAAIVALAGWLVLGWYFGDDQQINRRLATLQRLVAKTPAESDLAGLAAARAISDLFTESFTVRAEPRGFTMTDRRSLEAAIHTYRSRSTTLVMEVSDRETFFDESSNGANTWFTARFIADVGDLAATESYDFRVHWTKTDRGWLIDHVLVTGVDRLP